MIARCDSAVDRRIAPDADFDRRHAEIPASPLRHRDVVADAAVRDAVVVAGGDAEVLLDDEEGVRIDVGPRRDCARASRSASRKSIRSKLHGRGPVPMATAGRWREREDGPPPAPASATPAGTTVVSSQRIGPLGREAARERRTRSVWSVEGRYGEGAYYHVNFGRRRHDSRDRTGGDAAGHRLAGRRLAIDAAAAPASRSSGPRRPATCSSA